MSFPGVPPLLNQVNQIGNTVSLLKSDVANLGRLFGGATPTWGLFYQGVSVLSFDSMISMSYKREARIADFPMEQGAFQSYNKVQVPEDIRIRCVKGGSSEDRRNFLLQLKTLAGSLKLLTLIVPEGKYINFNVDHFDYRRTSENGMTLLAVDIWLRAINVTTATATYTNTAAPSGSSVIQTGTVLPQLPTPPQNAAIANVLKLP